MPPPVRPPDHSELRIRRDAEVARCEFRKRRLDEPLADYELKFPTAEAAANVVVDSLSALLTVPVDRELLGSLVANKQRYSTLRSLAATPISADDLNTLLRAKVNGTAVRRSQVLADEISALLTSCLDPRRFPWVVEARAATATELAAAKLATAVLTAASAVLAGRRGDERKALEGKVDELLIATGFTLEPKPRGGIQQTSHAPRPGTFMRTCTFGDHNADFVIGLRDGRILALECKASNSEVNGFKRLNKEVVVDAGDWYRRFGESNVVAAAALRGVFKPANIGQAQAQKVAIFWWHRLRSLEKFLKDTSP